MIESSSFYLIYVNSDGCPRRRSSTESPNRKRACTLHPERMAKLLSSQMTRAVQPV